ncbi:lysophospholipid acyltransferase family protein [Bryobacter aggregatus]|uniref:lysophospholipid acyltransferase family protein n=1 Tax=Bryobacter aggregatus TaxID=360054 RepID=UPI00068DBA19|nr:lysophospholipid acyltransferase family protein [Bryobacter aggregatus]
MSKPRSAVRNQFEAILLRSLLAVASQAPLGFSLALARTLDRLAPRLRQSAERNLQLALPPTNPIETTSGVYRSLGRMLYFFSRFPTRNAANIHDWIEYEGFEHYREAKALGKGVLFATGHIGNWELSAFAHAYLTEPMSVVVRPLDNPILDALIKRYRTLSGNRILDKQDFLRGILKALANNEAVGILIDQNTMPENGAFVDFFGIPASTGTTFAKLAHKTGAAVLPGYAIWSEKRNKYILRFDPIFPMSGDVATDTANLTRHFEGVIRQYPEQWLWLHRRWKTRPAGSPDLYS